MKSNQALIVVDVQNDFLETGALPVKEGSQVIPVINSLMPMFETVVLTQDWHPQGHISFASAHPDKKPYDAVEVDYGPQILWPDHCVAGTKGAELAENLHLSGREHLVRKGTDISTDCYSALKDARGAKNSDLAEWLQSKGIEEVYVCGLATDFCVSMTAQDLADEGFKTFVIEDACRAVDANGSLQKAKDTWQQLGIRRVSSQSLG